MMTSQHGNPNNLHLDTVPLLTIVTCPPTYKFANSNDDGGEDEEERRWGHDGGTGCRKMEAFGNTQKMYLNLVDVDMMWTLMVCTVHIQKGVHPQHSTGSSPCM